MLKMRVYSERSVTMNGVTTRTGEDTLPLVTDHGMFVADGLGGAAGIFVTTLAEECFDPDTLADRLLPQSPKQTAPQTQEPVDTIPPALLQPLTEAAAQSMPSPEEPVTEDSCDDAFAQAYRAYIKENFSSLACPDTQRLYRNPKDNMIRLKKSGYIGSHALGTAMAAILIPMRSASYAEWKEAVWDERNPGKESEKLFRTALRSYRDIIDRLGAQCAKTSMNKISYFGTTLSAVFYWEHEDEVEAIFLNCGDSRSYVWDADGFRQAAEDQGRKGGMTSLIRMNDLEDVQFSAERHVYKKPCVLMSMSDGIYSVFPGKNGFHSSPMRMEGYLMSALSRASSEEEFETIVKTMLDRGGSIDDSNSLAIAAFGYDDYADLKVAAAERVDYLTGFPSQVCGITDIPADYLMEDYEKIVEALTRSVGEEMHAYWERAFALSSIRSACLDLLSQGKIPASYCGKVQEQQALLDALRDKKERVLDKLAGLIRANFIDFINPESRSIQEAISKHLDKKGGNFQNSVVFSVNPVSILRAVREEGESWLEAYHGRIAILDELSRKKDTYDSAYNAYLDAMHTGDSRTWDETMHAHLTAAHATMKDNQLKYTEGVQKSLKAVSKYLEQLKICLENWVMFNGMICGALEKYDGEKSAKAIARSLLHTAKREGIGGLRTTIPHMQERIVQCVEEYLELGLEETALLEPLGAIRTECAKRYWMDNALTLITPHLDNEWEFAEDPALRSQILDRLNSDELGKAKRYQQAQAEVLARYMDMHLRDVSEDKRADVAQYGWL